MTAENAEGTSRKPGFFRLDRKLQNDLTIAFGIMMLFAANNTQIHIQKLITVSIQHDNPSYSADGYVIYGIMFSVLSITVWLSPAIVHFCGLRRSLILGALGSVPIATFFYFENTYLTYLSAGISGFTTGVLWTAQAVYLTLNSKIGDMYTSISIFAIIFQLSEVLGNGVIYFQFTDTNRLLDKATRMNIALILLTFVLSSVLILCFLRPAIREKDETCVNVKQDLTFCGQIKMAFAIVTTKNMMLACIYFLFIGMSVTFMNVMCTSFGFSNFLSSNSKKYNTFVGLIQGFGETIGYSKLKRIKVIWNNANWTTKSLSFGKRVPHIHFTYYPYRIRGGLSSFYLKKKVLFSRPLFVPFGCMANAVAHTVTALGLPDSAVYSYTDELPIVRIPFVFLMFANLLVGLSDAYLHIEAYNYIGTSYPYNSAPAFAVLKFTRYTASAMSFYYSNLFGLHIQALILLVLNTLSALSYFYLTSKSMMKQKQNQQPVNTNLSFTQQVYETQNSYNNRKKNSFPIYKLTN